MDRWRQINRMIFHLAACLLPAYNRCRWGNKVKNAFAQNAFSHVGEAVNWGKNVLISVDFINLRGFYHWRFFRSWRQCAYSERGNHWKRCDDWQRFKDIHQESQKRQDRYPNEASRLYGNISTRHWKRCLNR